MGLRIIIARRRSQALSRIVSLVGAKASAPSSPQNLLFAQQVCWRKNLVLCSSLFRVRPLCSLLVPSLALPIGRESSGKPAKALSHFRAPSSARLLRISAPRGGRLLKGFAFCSAQIVRSASVASLPRSATKYTVLWQFAFGEMHKTMTILCNFVLSPMA